MTDSSRAETRDELLAELNRCTKAELVCLLRNAAPFLSLRDVWYVRYEFLCRRAKKVMDEAQIDMERLTGDPRPEAITAFLAAGDRVDRANKDVDHAWKRWKR